MPEINLTPQEQKDRDVAAFSYFLLFAPVLLVTRKDSPEIQFHARQAFVLFVLFVILAVLGQPIGYLNFLVVGAAIAGFIQANLGRRWEIPLIAPIAGVGESSFNIIDVLKNAATTLKNIFVPSVKTAKNVSGLKSAVKQHAVDIDNVEERISFLEREVLILTVLRASALATLTKESRLQIENLKKNIIKEIGKAKEIDGPFATRLVAKTGEVIIGSYHDDHVSIYYTGINDDGGKTFGKFHGGEVLLSKVSDQEKLIEKIAKHL